MVMRYYPGMPNNPSHSSEVEMLEKPKGRIMINLSNEDVNSLQTAIVVEMWDKAVGMHSYGRVRREWLKQFNPQERKRAGHLHSRFYEWHLRTGIPQNVVMRWDTIEFIQRLVYFFATV